MSSCSFDDPKEIAEMETTYINQGTPRRPNNKTHTVIPTNAVSGMRKTSETMMMEVLVTFPLHEFDIDLSILEEFMLIIYQPRNANDDRFDQVDENFDANVDTIHKPLVFTQKSSKNHVIIDGIHEISFRLELPKGPYVYLHKQKDRFLLNEGDKLTTLGGGRIVNYLTPDNKPEIHYTKDSPVTLSPRHETFNDKKEKPADNENAKNSVADNDNAKNSVTDKANAKNSVGKILNGIDDLLVESGS